MEREKTIFPHSKLSKALVVRCLKGNAQGKKKNKTKQSKIKKRKTYVVNSVLSFVTFPRIAFLG